MTTTRTLRVTADADGWQVVEDVTVNGHYVGARYVAGPFMFHGAAAHWLARHG